MRFVPVSAAHRQAMLASIGVGDAGELFADIPECARLDRPLALAEGVSEMEASSRLSALAAANEDLVCFAGAGCYDHYVPSIVDHVLRRPEFFTAYTPYQPEVSQGTLQNIYEFQTMVCELTGMDVANASMYDGATAMTEAALMASRVTKRSRILVAGSVHPEWREVLHTYASAGTLAVEEIPVVGGALDIEALRSAIGDDTAAVLVASPNVYGCFEDLAAIGRLAKKADALLVVAPNPALLGVLEPPSAFGADIVVAEGQPLGIPMSFGGPGLGLFAARQEHLRQMPGRIVGRTLDADGNTGFVLTVQTREQHIRREKATSNICSNHALTALASAVYLSSVGASGLAETGNACLTKACYLRRALLATGRFSAPWDRPFAHEFALRFDGDVEQMRAALAERGFLAGVGIEALHVSCPSVPATAEASGLVVFAVTEKRTSDEMDALAEAVRGL